MKKGLTRTLVAMLLLALVMVPALALADSETDTAGNELFSQDLTGKSIELDAYGTGETVNMQDSTVGASALLAGKDLMVSGSTIGGSLRAAGYNIVVNNTELGANATLAGYSITLGSGTTAKAVYAASNTFTFSGTCDTMGVYANTVTLNGTVNGDAQIYAENVVIGDNAVVTGSLNISAATEPVVPASAKIGALSFTTTETTPENAETAATVSTAVGILGKLKKLIINIPGRMVLAVLYFFTISATVKKSGDMLKKRPAPMLLSGLIAIIAAPIAIVLLLCTVIGIPSAMLLSLLLSIALGFAISFTACAVGQLVFTKLHGLVASIIGVAAFSVLGIVPILGGVLTFACMLYTVGYFIQVIFLNWPRKTAADAAAAEAASAETAAVTAENGSETV